MATPLDEFDNAEIDGMMVAASQLFEKEQEDQVLLQASQLYEQEQEDQLLLQASQEYEGMVELQHSQAEQQAKRSSRWGSPVTEGDINSARKAGMPKKSRSQMEWCERVWADWAEYRSKNDMSEEEKRHILTGNICEMTPVAMNFWLCRFIMEARRQDNNPYPPQTLKGIACGLMRSLKGSDRADINFFSDPIFNQFRDVLDSRMKALAGTGQFVQRKAEIITIEQENLLWEKGLLGDKTPQQLLDTIIFYNSLYSLFVVVKNTDD